MRQRATLGRLIHRLVRPLVSSVDQRVTAVADGHGRPQVRRRTHAEPGFDVIVVLGAPLGPGGVLGGVARERVEAGAAAWGAGWAQRLLFTGGATDPSLWADVRAGIFGAHVRQRAGVAEAAAMRAHAIGLGVPEAAILLEDRARSTEENARYTATMMREHGLRHALLVTQPFHLRRSVMLFRREGIDAAILDVESSFIYAGGWSSLRALHWVVREYIILTGTALRQRLR